MKLITSTDNALVKELVRIKERPSYRHKHQSIVVSGHTIITELAQHCPPRALFIQDAAMSHPACAELYQVSAAVLKKITGELNPEGIAALFALPHACALEGKKRIIVADHIADPGNLGTLMRTALAFAFDGFFLLGGVDPFNEKVLRASRGALFRLSFEIGDWARLSKLLAASTAPLLVADTKGQPLTEVGPYEEFFLLLSNESQGPSPEALSYGRPVSIAMAGAMESLNVAIAGAIIMYALTAPSHR